MSDTNQSTTISSIWYESTLPDEDAYKFKPKNETAIPIPLTEMKVTKFGFQKIWRPESGKLASSTNQRLLFREKLEASLWKPLKGKLFEQIEMIFDEKVSLVLRLYDLSNDQSQDIELSWTVLPYFIVPFTGRNMVIKFNTAQ